MLGYHMPMLVLLAIILANGVSQTLLKLNLGFEMGGIGGGHKDYQVHISGLIQIQIGLGK